MKGRPRAMTIVEREGEGEERTNRDGETDPRDLPDELVASTVAPAAYSAATSPSPESKCCLSPVGIGGKGLLA